ncbi:MAG: CvpA family protein [Herpetosiphonaceae bacterium]|nr:CvpA family protein [Herpetosiphonaceae bacterium]
MAPLPILIAILLIFGPLNGLRRGAIREGTALIGILLGALLAQGWGATWAQRLGGVAAAAKGHSTTEKVLTLGLLIGIALLCGYGSGVLLPRRTEKMAITQRLGGGVLGFINMGLLCGFALLFIQHLWYDPFTLPTTSTTNPGTVIPDVGTSWIQRTPLTRLLVERLGLILLGVAVAFAFASLIVGLVRLMGVLRRPVAAPQKQPVTPLPLGATGTPAPRPGTTSPSAQVYTTPPATPAMTASSGSGATATTTAVPIKPAASQSTSSISTVPSSPLFRDDTSTPRR